MTTEVLLSPEELEALAANCDGCTLRIEPMEADGDWMTYIRAHADGSTFTLHVRLDHGGEAHVEREDFERTEPMSVEEARAVTRAPIEVGKQYEFYAEMQQDYEPSEKRMRNYTGQTVTVVRALRGQNEPDPETDWFEPYEENGELIEPEVSKGFVVRAHDGFEFHALEEELDGWDRDLGQFFWPDGTFGWNHDTTFLVNEQPERVRQQSA